MNSLKFTALGIYTFLIAGCAKDLPEDPITTYPLPPQIDADMAALLTERHETEHFIFYFRAGDIIEYERCEAYAEWAIDYLGITLPKKIEFFKFKDCNEVEKASGVTACGIAFPYSTAFCTYWKWHNHETFHVLEYLWRDPNPKPGFFQEGIAVAHELDPYNNDWEPRNTRYHNNPNQESYLSSIKRFKHEEKLFALEDIITNDKWWALQPGQILNDWVTHPQAGIFTYYLIECFGLDQYKKLYSSLRATDDFETINNRFVEALGINLNQIEEDWLLWLD